jgi:hypothetical protein
LLVIIPSPHLGVLTCPSTPKVLQAKEHAPTSNPSDIFILDSHLNLSKSLGVRHLSLLAYSKCPLFNLSAVSYILYKFERWDKKYEIKKLVAS